MSISNAAVADQLKRICKISNSNWAVIVSQATPKPEWDIFIVHGLMNSQQGVLKSLISQEKFQRWLDKSAKKQKAYYRSLKEFKEELNCNKIFAFPSNLSNSIILVGANQLNKTEKEFYKILGLGFGLPGEIYKTSSGDNSSVPHSKDKVHSRSRSMSPVNEIVQEIMGLSDFSEIAEKSAQLLAKQYEYEMVLVMLLDEPLQELVAEGVAGSSTQGVPKGFRYAKDLGIPGEVLQTGKSVLISDAMDSKNYYPIPGWEPGSVICTPLIMNDKVFGVINIEYQTPNLVNEYDLQQLTSIGNMLSGVFINAQRYQQLQNNIAQLEAVRETALELGKDLDLGVLMRRVVIRVRDLVDARGAELGLVDEKEKLVRVLVSENPWQDYTGYSFPLMSGVAGRIAALGEPLAVADFNSWSGKAESDFKAPFTTVAGVPLKLSGEIIGTLSVQDDRPTRAFSSADIQTLELLAPQLSIFIRNARLYHELEETVVAQRLAEERLVRSAKMAAIGEMAAAIAHELNNPLTTVTGFTELILESMSEDSPEFKDLSLVLKEAQRSRTVVRRLLDFSRQGEILHVESDINEIISTVLALVHHIAQTSGTEVRLELWDDLPMISIDRNQIQQVFLNLIHNGIQAMPDGGELFIDTQLEQRESGEWIGVIFKDSGEGIDKENLDRIFEPFFTTKPSGEGTGLGLSVSYNIVSEHGGYIDVESQEGKGAVFSVWLPVNDVVTKPSEISDA